MKQLINYKPLKEKLEEYPYVKIMPNTEVLLDLPMAVIDFGTDYDKPVLFGSYKGIPMIFDEHVVKESLSKMRLFYLRVDGEKLHEVPEAEADLKMRLPIETKIDELIYKDGQLVWAKPVVEKEGVTDGN